MILSQISEFFSKIKVTELAFAQKFQCDPDAKINVVDWLVSFFQTLDQGVFSWTDWAQRLALSMEELCSPNALRQKASFRHLPFCRHLLYKILHQSFQRTDLPGNPKWGPWPRVWVTDSSCFSLPVSMAHLFPGPYSSKGKCATAKIQLTLDLKTDNIGLLEVASFRDNDQSYSPDIFKIAQPGDLVIRDLGYSVCSVFNNLNTAGIDFISRLKYGIKVYNLNGEPIQLLADLRKTFRNGARKIDRPVLLSKRKVPVRLIVFQRPKNQYELLCQRRQKDRHHRAAHDEDYYEQLRYAVWITNVEAHVADAQTIGQLYRLRWRIEILFKCWKSHLHLDQTFQKITSANPSITWVLLYLTLVKVVLYHQQILLQTLQHLEALAQKGLPISILRLYHIFAKHGTTLAQIQNTDFVHQFIRYFAYYSKDKNRTSHCEKIYLLNLNSS